MARYGGEEFTILLPDCGEAEVAIVADRVLHAVRTLRVTVPSQRTLAVTVSAGVAVARPNETAAELIVRADRALYQSKRAGRNGWSAARPVLRAVDAAAE